MAKKYFSEKLGDAFYGLIGDLRQMSLPDLYKELGHVNQLSTTNCGWGEYEVREAAKQAIQDRIRVLEYERNRKQPANEQ